MQRRCAVLVGRGLDYGEAAKAIGVGRRQVERWMSPTSGIPGMRELAAAEREQVYEPGALDTLRQLLSSESETIKLNAAKALLLQRPEDAVEEKKSGNEYGVTQVVIHFNRDKDGNPIFGPVDADGNPIPLPDGDEVIDAEAVEVPGHGMLPPAPDNPDW